MTERKTPYHCPLSPKSVLGRRWDVRLNPAMQMEWISVILLTALIATLRKAPYVSKDPDQRLAEELKQSKLGCLTSKRLFPSSFEQYPAVTARASF